MKSIGSFLERKRQRREAFHTALGIVRKNQGFLTSEQTDILVREISTAYITSEFRDLVSKHFGPDAIPNPGEAFFKNSPRERR